MTGEPGPWLTRLRERGLLAVASGHNVIRFLPPLNATTADLARSVEILRETLRAA
jgi:4-aminobutyrate aminotransferase-like enzyme